MGLQSFTEIDSYFFQSFRLDYSKFIQPNAIPKKWSKLGEGVGVNFPYVWMTQGVHNMYEREGDTKHKMGIKVIFAELLQNLLASLLIFYWYIDI